MKGAPFNPKHIVGKTIARVDMDPTRQREGPGVRTMHDPTIHFTDGSSISFIAEEPTGDMDTYGVDIIYRKPAKGHTRTCACGLPWNWPLHKESSSEYEHLPFVEVVP